MTHHMKGPRQNLWWFEKLQTVTWQQLPPCHHPQALTPTTASYGTLHTGGNLLYGISNHYLAASLPV